MRRFPISADSGRFGPWMFGLFWVTALGLLTLYFSGVLEQRHNPNQRLESSVSATGQQQVVLERNAYGHYVAMGSINGQPVEFLVDTGATYLGIPAAVARRLQLKEGAASFSQTAGGVVRTYLVKLDNVSLGGIQRHGVTASVLPDMPGEGVLLGMSFLKDLEIVQSGNTLTLRW
ncbi:MAG: retropepsin-like aspartic protease [Gammaproteobacteria bacterium]|nr:retropepsin-like aspartic protease [Gammaproteobacteria bacterium]